MAKLRHVLPLAHLLGRTRLEGQRAARIENGAKAWQCPVACSGAAATRGEGNKMSRAGSEFRRQFLTEARHSIEKHYLPQITRCLKLLSEEDLWWKSHSTSNSVGNLVLHLSGNVRQWIISGLGGAPDVRERDKEFA